MSKYRTYLLAAKRLEDHWAQGSRRNSRGDVCMVQSVVEALYRSNLSKFLPVSYQREIHKKLRSYPSYRIYFVWYAVWRRHPQRAIETWNDSIWRRQKTVIKVLEQLAANHKNPTIVDPPGPPVTRVQDSPRPQDRPTIRPV